MNIELYTHNVQLKGVEALSASSLQHGLNGSEVAPLRRHILSPVSSRIPMSPAVHLLNPVSSLKQFVRKFDASWSPETGGFNFRITVPEFVKIMKCYNGVFHRIFNPSTHFGFIEKRDVHPGTKIFVRADLHGDIKSVLEHLKTLQKEGLLDDDYRCKPHSYLVFLGDYVDRGTYNLETLALLYLIKMINRDQVILIRGNHETASVNEKGAKKEVKKGKGDENFLEVLMHQDHRRELASTYDTMPLTLYIAEKTEGQREYLHYTHTGFEPTVDPAGLLDRESDQAVMLVPKNFEFSKRLQELRNNADAMPPHLRNAVDELFTLAHNESNTRFRTSKSAKSETQEPLVKSGYSWPQLNRLAYSVSTSTDVDTDEGWAIAPSAYRAYQLLSSDKHRVEGLLRGHDHTFSDVATPEGTIFIKTLPVGADSLIWKKRGGEKDTSWILTTDRQITKWTRQVYTRTCKSDVTTSSGPYKLMQAQVPGLEKNK